MLFCMTIHVRINSGVTCILGSILIADKKNGKMNEILERCDPEQVFLHFFFLSLSVSLYPRLFPFCLHFVDRTIELIPDNIFLLHIKHNNHSDKFLSSN